MPVLTQEQAVTILARYAEGLEGWQHLVLLAEKNETRIVNGQPVTLHDPYATALAYIMNPRTLRQKTEGAVTEAYADLNAVAQYLRDESAALRASWPIGDAQGSTASVNTDMDLLGWKAN